MKLSGFTSLYTFEGPSSTGTTPLSAQHPYPDPSPLTHPMGPLLSAWSSLMHQACNTRTHLTGTSHSQVSLGTSTIPACLIPLPGSCSSLKFAGEYTCTPYAHPLCGDYRQSPASATGTRHAGCDIWPCSNCQH